MCSIKTKFNILSLIIVVLPPACWRRSLVVIPRRAIGTHYLARSQRQLPLFVLATMVGVHEEFSDCH